MVAQQMQVLGLGRQRWVGFMMDSEGLCTMVGTMPGRAGVLKCGLFWRGPKLLEGHSPILAPAFG